MLDTSLRVTVLNLLLDLRQRHNMSILSEPGRRLVPQFPRMTPEEMQELHLRALKHGRESSNHLLVRFDQLNQVVNQALDPITNNEAKPADVLPEANEELEKTLQQIQAEYK